jgi:epidermal growth factor receptor substrate 15
MGLKLVGKEGDYLCIECREEVSPDSKRCEKCGMVFDGNIDGKKCKDCGKLIRVDADSCPLCSKTSSGDSEVSKPKEKVIQLKKSDEEFLSNLLTWTAKTTQREVDSPEDVKEREHAMEVIKAVATIEPDEEIKEEFAKLGETAIKKEELEERQKQLIELGKPFETVLKKSMESIDDIKKKIDEKEGELRDILEQKGKKKRKDVKKPAEIKKEIKDLNVKKEALESQEKNIMQMGSAYSTLLDKQHESLSEAEADLKKRIQAFQKEVERRKKISKALKTKELALDEREEVLSKRFLDLKRRENEVLIKEQRVEKLLSDPNLTSKDSKEGDTGKEGQEDAAIMEKDTKLKEFEKEIEKLKERNQELDNIINDKDSEIKNLKVKIDEKIDVDTQKILKILDELLEKLPEEVVDNFARSDDFSLYEKVLEKYRV